MECPYYRVEDGLCKMGSVEVSHIACARRNLCTGKRYEACPLYFAGFFYGPKSACAAAT